jgi:hypothetical protein
VFVALDVIVIGTVIAIVNVHGNDTVGVIGSPFKCTATITGSDHDHLDDHVHDVACGQEVQPVKSSAAGKTVAPKRQHLDWIASGSASGEARRCARPIATSRVH